MTLEEAKKMASEKAITEGYDQLIFRNKKNSYGVKRSTKAEKTRPIKLVGFVRVFYKDHKLFTRYFNEKEE